MNGNEQPKKSPGIGMRLKLYKKPKPGQPASEPPESKEPLNFLEQLEQEPPNAPQTPQHTIPAEAEKAKRSYILLAVLLGVLCFTLFYFNYTPAPPDVIGPRNRTSLLPVCQKNNGVACGELALLEYLGQNSLNWIPKETAESPTKAAVYGRLACSRNSSFGCYMLWRMWTKKETNLLKADSSIAALERCCSLDSPLCCVLHEKVPGKSDVTPDDIHKAISEASGGKDPLRHSGNVEEQRLYTIFLATEK